MDWLESSLNSSRLTRYFYQHHLWFDFEPCFCCVGSIFRWDSFAPALQPAHASRKHSPLGPRTHQYGRVRNLHLLGHDHGHWTNLDSLWLVRSIKSASSQEEWTGRPIRSLNDLHILLQTHVSFLEAYVPWICWERYLRQNSSLGSSKSSLLEKTSTWMVQGPE